MDIESLKRKAFYAALYLREAWGVYAVAGVPTLLKPSEAPADANLLYLIEPALCN